MMLAGKTVLVTGASSGIGRAVVSLATKEGAKAVVATGRNKDALMQLREETGCHVVVGDLTGEGECARIVKESVELMGGLSTLVNCAGVLKGGNIDTVGLDNFMYNFNNNTKTVFEMIHNSIPHLKEAGEGSSITTVSSVNGLQSFGGCSSYCASKAAVDMLTKCAAIDLAPYKIRVNSVCPGVVVTELQKRGGLTEEGYAAFQERSKTVTHPLAIPRGELAQPEDVANLIVFLASDRAKWITGDNVKIDGGRSAAGLR